jgi:hypothetical protein
MWSIGLYLCGSLNAKIYECSASHHHELGLRFINVAFLKQRVTNPALVARIAVEFAHSIFQRGVNGNFTVHGFQGFAKCRLWIASHDLRCRFHRTDRFLDAVAVVWLGFFGKQSYS